MRDMLFSAIVIAVWVVVFIHVRPWLWQYLALLLSIGALIPRR